MKFLKKLLTEIFIDGLSGMATGLFSTLIVGTIIKQLGGLIPDPVGGWLVLIGSVASAATGVGIGVGLAVKLKATPLVVVSAAVAGFVGAYAGQILNGAVINGSVTTLTGPGEPMGAFVASLVTVYVGRLVAGKTKVDILITPLVTILCGAAVGLLLGPPISRFMTMIGSVINAATQQQPFLMGILVSVLMGIVLTLPISSAAIGVSLGLSGLAAGAATVGCCANMVGFAVASYRENKMNGLLAQGLGTSMLQMPNIVRRPIIWLPAILSSAILGPVSTMVFGMTNNPVGSGMGSAGLVGQIATFQTMTAEGGDPWLVLAKIVVIQFILPAALALLCSELMRKKGWIRVGDMKLEVN